MSVCPDGQGICKRHTNNQPSCSSVSRDEGLVCFPPLNQPFTICWACWQSPSVANSLRDMTFAPRYQDAAPGITSTPSLFSKVIPESYTQRKEKTGRGRGLGTEVMDTSWSFRKGSDSGCSIGRRCRSLQMLGNTLWFSREGNKCKAPRDCRREAHVKRWGESSIPRMLPEFGRQRWADGSSWTDSSNREQRPSWVTDPQRVEWQCINMISL